MTALLADLVVLAHFAFIVFVLFGGLLALVWPRVVWLHVPAALWGCFVELSGTICPLTPLESWLRLPAGTSPDAGDFIARYVTPVVYPPGLTRSGQLALAALLVVINLAIYGTVLRRLRLRSTGTSTRADFKA